MSISLDPSETLRITKPLHRVIECPLRISNANAGPVAFKVKTTDPKHFCVRPNQGIIQPGKTADVQVLTSVMNEELLASFVPGKAKFLILTMLLTPEDEGKAPSDLPWTGASKVHQRKLRVEFVDVSAQDPPESMMNKPSRPKVLPLIFLDPNDHLSFQRPLTRRIEHALVVTNIHTEPIAVKVKTNNSKRYTARPNVCRLEPGANIRISINLVEMLEDPPSSFECKDKILVQSAVVTPERDKMPLLDIFAPPSTPPSEEELVVRDCKLGVVYLPVPVPAKTANLSPPPSPPPKQAPISNDEKKSPPPSLLAKTMNRLRRASWRHSGSGAR